MEGFIEKVNNFFETNGMRILQALAILVFGYLIIKLLLLFLKRTLKKTRIDPIIQPYVSSAIKIVAYIILFVTVAGTLGFSMTSLATILGTVGLAFSLSLQNSLSNMIDGIFIMLSKPFKKGDLVNIEGVEGLVESIGLVYTKVKTVDRQILIPNSDVASAKITDVSVIPERRYDANFTVRFDADIDHVRKVTRAAIEKSGLSVESMEPVISVAGFGDNGIKMVARVWVKNDDYWTFNNYIYEALKKSFDKEGIRLARSLLDVAVSPENEMLSQGASSPSKKRSEDE